MVGSGRISNSSKLICMSSLPASMKMMMKNSGENVMSHFLHYKSMGFFSDAQGQPTP